MFKRTLFYKKNFGTFETLHSIITNKRRKQMAQQQKVGTHATKVFTENGVTFVKYWNTRVVSFTESTISLNNGGFLTNTTKTRMNQASNEFDLGYRVYQKNFDWFVEHNGKTHEFIGNSKTLNRN